MWTEKFQYSSWLSNQGQIEIVVKFWFCFSNKQKHQIIVEKIQATSVLSCSLQPNLKNARLKLPLLVVLVQII